jgi:hypothetical protein
VYIVCTQNLPVNAVSWYIDATIAGPSSQLNPCAHSVERNCFTSKGTRSVAKCLYQRLELEVTNQFSLPNLAYKPPELPRSATVTAFKDNSVKSLASKTRRWFSIQYLKTIQLSYKTCKLLISIVKIILLTPWHRRQDAREYLTNSLRNIGRVSIDRGSLHRSPSAPTQLLNCHDLFIWQPHFRSQYPTSEHTPSQLAFDHITEGFNIR